MNKKCNKPDSIEDVTGKSLGTTNSAVLISFDRDRVYMTSSRVGANEIQTSHYFPFDLRVEYLLPQLMKAVHTKVKTYLKEKDLPNFISDHVDVISLDEWNKIRMKYQPKPKPKQSYRSSGKTCPMWSRLQMMSNGCPRVMDGCHRGMDGCHRVKYQNIYLYASNTPTTLNFIPGTVCW